MEFQKNSKDVLGIIRQTILTIHQDKNLDASQREGKIKQFVDTFLELNLKLDHEAFADEPTVQQGIPDYIPDGLIDMGSDQEPDASVRNKRSPNSRREQIQVSKKEIFDQSKDLIYALFTNPALSKLDPKDTKLNKWMVERIALEVYSKMPYDHKTKGPETGDIVQLHDIRTNSLAVCRLFTNSLSAGRYNIASDEDRCYLWFQYRTSCKQHSSNK